MRTKQPAWGPPVVVGGGARHGYHAAAALHTTKSVESRVSCTEKPLRRHMQPLQETLAGTRLVYLLSYRCTPPPSAEASGGGALRTDLTTPPQLFTPSSPSDPWSLALDKQNLRRIKPMQETLARSTWPASCRTGARCLQVPGTQQARARRHFRQRCCMEQRKR